MRLRKSTSVAALVAALALTVTTTACGSGSDSGDGGSKVSVGLSLSTLGNPFFVQMKKGAEEAAQAQGVDLRVTDAQNDASQQANQVQNFTSQNMRAIIINPVDSDAAAPSVKLAEKQDIPVVAADRGVNGAEVSTTVASDNVRGGTLAADTLARELGEKGTIVVLEGISGTSASRERGEGFTQGLKKYPGITVAATQPADFDRTKGMDVMTNLLQAHPDITGVFAQNDEMALGAVKALGDRAGTSVSVVGFDGTPDGVQAVADGTLAATVAQQPAELGKMAVANAVRLADGEDVEETIKVPVRVVTAKNAGDFR